MASLSLSCSKIKHGITLEKLFLIIHTNGIFARAGKQEFLTCGTQLVESAPRDAAENGNVKRLHKFLSEQVKILLTDRASFTFNIWPLLFQELGLKLSCNWN